MSDDTRPEVMIRADRGTESIGENAYFETHESSFDKKAFWRSLLVALCLTSLVYAVMYLVPSTPRTEKKSQALAAPSLIRSDSDLNPKLLTERDLVNLIPHPRVENSYLGRIKVVSLRSSGVLPIGSEMKASLESGATDGLVKASLKAALLVDGEPLLPEKTILFGHGKSGEERLFVEFTKAILPTGESFPIRAQAFDVSDRIQGLKGAIVGTRSKKMAGAIAFGFLGGMADGLQDTSGSLFTEHRPSTRDAALSGASKAALDQSQVYIDEMKKSPNIIEVKTGTEIVVITDEPKNQELYEAK